MFFLYLDCNLMCAEQIIKLALSVLLASETRSIFCNSRIQIMTFFSPSEWTEDENRNVRPRKIVEFHENGEMIFFLGEQLHFIVGWRLRKSMC